MTLVDLLVLASLVLMPVALILPDVNPRWRHP